MAAVLTLSCAGFLHGSRPMAPDQAGAGAWERLARLRSFGFTLSFHTDMPLPIDVKFSGVRDQSDREAWSGYMRRMAEMSRVEMRAGGSEQYEREGSGWRRTMRGIETRVLEQGEGTFRGRPLEYIGAELGRYRFAFKPDLPILDPTQTKRLSGVMEVDPRSGLPVRLYCRDSAGTAEWELRLGRFNRAGSVEVPYEPAMTVDARPSRPLGRTAFGHAAAIITARLEKLGWEHRLRRTSRGLALLLGQTKSRRHVELLFSRGNVEVWQGRWLGTGESTDAAVDVGGDAARRVVLERRLASNGQLAAEVLALTPLTAALVTAVALPDNQGPAVLVVDGTAMSAVGSDPSGRAVFRDLGNVDELRVIAALASGEVMPADFVTAVKP